MMKGRKLLNPENIWIHCTVALCVIIGLLCSAYLTNRAIIAQHDLVARTTVAAQDLSVLSQQIMLQAIDPDQDIGIELIARFEATHAVLLRGNPWSAALQDHYFAGLAPLDERITQFAGLANQMAQLPASDHAPIVAQMQTLLGSGALSDGLRQAATLFGDASRSDIDRLHGLLNLYLLIAAFVLLAEALLVFRPAHLAVRSVFRELRAKTEVLTSSQEQLRRMNDKLYHLANHDPLTGLPNRSYMTTRLSDALAQPGWDELGILFIGLDGFKAINDTIGHENADIMLIAMAGRLKACVDDDDLVARVGGDEFILTTSEPPENLTKRILNSLSESFVIDGRSVSVDTSIGYLTAFAGESEADQIVRNAGVALQAAKAAGGRRAVEFSQALRDESAEMLELQLELRDAIAAGQIEPWFQPQINLADGTIRGAEVLARWRHPKRGLLTPDKFLPAAEHAGLVIDLDHAIWRAAVNCAQQWEGSDDHKLAISLNAAPDTISDPFLIERLLKMLHGSTLRLDQIVVEVLETTLIEGSDDMAAINIDSLAECGVALELDDFGTGYASLSKLTQLPLSGIKLDRSLIAPLPDTGADSVVRAILALAAELGLQVIAEGIETDDQARYLRNCRCEIGQGYGFAHPMPAPEFDTWLKEYASRPQSFAQPPDQIPMQA